MTHLSRDVVLRASEDWKWVPPGAETLTIEGVTVIDYPEWARMGFHAMPCDVAEPLTAVAAVQQAARERGRKTVDWWLSPASRPSMEQTLIANGAHLSVALDILALDLSNGLPEIPESVGVESHVVDDAKRLEDAERVAATVWGGEPSSGERRAAQLKSLARVPDDDGGFRVVSYRDGRAITTAGCQLADGVARLYAGCTIPDARGLGGYRASVAKRLDVAWHNGARFALVHARVETSGPILTRMGFQPYGEARVYDLAAAEPDPGSTAVEVDSGRFDNGAVSFTEVPR